jgi:hypothetical protein
VPVPLVLAPVVTDKMPHPPLVAAVASLVGVASLGLVLAAGARRGGGIAAGLALVAALVRLFTLDLLLWDGPGGTYESLRSELGGGYFATLLAAGALPAIAAAWIGARGVGRRVRTPLPRSTSR